MAATVTEGDNIKIKLNYPLIPDVIKQDLSAQCTEQNQHANLLSYPTVRGYLLEETFFSSKENEIEIMVPGIKDVTAITLMIEGCLKMDIILKSMDRGVLYCLRAGHPFVDGIGLLRDQCNKY